MITETRGGVIEMYLALRGQDCPILHTLKEASGRSASSVGQNALGIAGLALESARGRPPPANPDAGQRWRRRALRQEPLRAAGFRLSLDSAWSARSLPESAPAGPPTGAVRTGRRSGPGGSRCRC